MADLTAHEMSAHEFFQKKLEEIQAKDARIHLLETVIDEAYRASSLMAVRGALRVVVSSHPCLVRPCTLDEHPGTVRHRHEW